MNSMGPLLRLFGMHLSRLRGILPALSNDSASANHLAAQWGLFGIRKLLACMKWSKLVSSGAARDRQQATEGLLSPIPLLPHIYVSSISQPTAAAMHLCIELGLFFIHAVAMVRHSSGSGSRQLVLLQGLLFLCSCCALRFLYLGPAGSWTPLHSDVLRSFSW